MTDQPNDVDHDLLAEQVAKARERGRQAAQPRTPGVHVPIKRGSAAHFAMVEVSLGRPLTAAEKREYAKPAEPSAPNKFAVNDLSYAKGDVIIDGWTKTSGH